MFFYLFNPERISPPITAQTMVLVQGFDAMGQAPVRQPMNL